VLEVEVIEIDGDSDALIDGEVVTLGLSEADTVCDVDGESEIEAEGESDADGVSE
jgi:hypothetical protein